MSNLKNNLRRAMRNISVILPMTSKMKSEQARDILNINSPKPPGTCTTNNLCKIGYDLQIIVPAYNEENYVGQCLKSVFLQESKYKVLVSVVDDGSTDGTAVVLHEFAENVGGSITLEVITQGNKGFSGARNAALKNIKGTYVAFLDSDDILVDGAIQKMLDKAFEYDAEILQGSWYTFCGEQRENHIISKDGVLTDNHGVFSGYPWGKLYKYNVLEHFQFPEGFWFEDTPLSFIIAAMSYRCAAIKDIVYGYRQNPDGITMTSRKKIRSIESYWITEECLKEFPAFGLSYDQRAYEYLLRQSLMNDGRIRCQPRMIREAVFVLTAELMKTYFAGFNTMSPQMKRVEQALKKHQFIKFELLARGT